jgi:hypothetical protein
MLLRSEDEILKKTREDVIIHILIGNIHILTLSVYSSKSSSTRTNTRYTESGKAQSYGTLTSVSTKGKRRFFPQVINWLQTKETV